MEIRPIHTDKDHKAALAEIEAYWGAPGFERSSTDATGVSSESGNNGFVGGLHAYPVDGAVAEQFAKPNRRPGVSSRIGLALAAGLYSLERKPQKTDANWIGSRTTGLSFSSAGVLAAH